MFEHWRHPRSSAAVAVTLLTFGVSVFAAESAVNAALRPSQIPAALAVRAMLPPPPAGVTDIKFGEMIRMPIGPAGLEPTDKLLALAGRRVRMVGFMVRQDNATPGSFILSPVPVALGDEDESLSDDLPPTAVFVHFEDRLARPVPYAGGLLHMSGTLEVGAKDEGDGHVSSYRLRLDPVSTRLITSLGRIPAAVKPARVKVAAAQRP